MTKEMTEKVCQLLADNNHEQLRMLPLSRYELRTIVMPLLRRKLGEVAPVRAPGLTSNWAGKSLMSRCAV